MGAVRDNLTCRRIAAHVLNEVMKTHHLGTKAHRFNSDMFEDWQVINDWQIWALIDNKHVADVDLVDNYAIVTIQDWYDVIRQTHVGEFNPAEHDCHIDDGYEPVSRIPFPDAQYQIEYGEVPGMDLPERVMPRQSRGRAPRVICSR